MSKSQQPWKVVSHFGQIADTGDYSGHYEITNGKDSLYVDDYDNDESILLPIAEAMNASGCNISVDDSPLMAERAESSFWKRQAMRLAARVYAYCHMNKSGGYNGDGRAPEEGSIYEIAKELLPTNHPQRELS